MVFSSVPVYLDPPNWPNHQQGDGVDESEGSGLLQSAMPPPPLPPAGSLIRPSSMTERARLAKIPLPEAALKCPRCDSNNTKFCYFNNYSLSQPRHFCKTCRRYWTRGGALRNVPVGGGCRRNKRTKGSRSKSPARAEQQNGGAAMVSSSANNNNITRAASDILAAHLAPPLPPQMTFLPPMHNLSGFSAPDLGLNFSGSEMEFQVGNNSGGINLSARFADLFRLQHGITQLPFLAGLDQSNGGGLYQFEAGVDQYDVADQLGGKPFETISGAAHQANVKLEENGSNNNNNGINISRNFLGMANNDQFWSGNNGIINNNGFITDPMPGYASATSRLL